MNPICNYFGYLFLNYCLLEQGSEERIHIVPAPRVTSVRSAKPYDVEFEWEYINYTWPSEDAYEDSVKKGHYIPENVVLTGMKYYKDYIYLSMPQHRKGVPVTLGRLSVTDSEKFNPLIVPYPSWEMNVHRKSCGNLQSVHSMEIDKNGIMWVLDGVRMNDNTKCPPKLLLLDLNKEGIVVLSYIFPRDVSLSSGGFLNDIVIDETDGGYAYITDNSNIDPGLIIYSRKQNRAWKLRDSSMYAENVESTINNATFNKMVNIDGIALSPPHSKTGAKLLFYGSLNGFKLYSIKNKILKNRSLYSSGEWRRGIKMVGKRSSLNDGMIIDNKANLYFTLLSTNGIGKWNINLPFSTTEVIARSEEDFSWPDTFAFDDKGYLRVLVNNANKYIGSDGPLSLSRNVPEFKIIKIFTEAKSYLSY